MQLKIQRSQRTGGVLGKTVFFALDVRADYTRTEQENIAKYKLGSAVIYNSAASRRHLDNAKARNDGSVLGITKGLASVAMAALNLNITMDTLGRGQHIECKDLFELVEAEATIMEACQNIKHNLALAESFDGRIILVDFDGDEPQAHQSQGMPDLERYVPPSLRQPAPEFIASPQADDSAIERALIPDAGDLPLNAIQTVDKPSTLMEWISENPDRAYLAGGALLAFFVGVWMYYG